MYNIPQQALASALPISRAGTSICRHRALRVLQSVSDAETQGPRPRALPNLAKANALEPCERVRV
eukprot:6185501-Pleurochrysis_carterae.AAC.1